MKICITSCTTPSLSSSSLILLARAAVTLVGTTVKLIIKILTVIITSIKHQCPAGTRTRPATRYFFRYPTRPDSVLEIIG